MELWTIKEAAKYLKMNEHLVCRLVEAGKIPAVKTGSHWRLDKNEVNDWLGSQMGELPAEDLIHLEKDHKQVVIKIAPLLKKENVIFEIMPTSTKVQVLQNLVGVLAKNYKLNKKDEEKLFHAVIDRERMCSTAIGEGIAIPHPRTAVIKQTKKPILILGVCRQGIDLESLDGRLTTLIFLICAPRDDIHLKLMARLSRLLKDRRFVFQLTHAGDFAAIKKIITEREIQL